MEIPAWRWTLRATVFGGAATVAVLALPGLYLAYENPSMHIAFETAAASIALLAAYLVLGQFRQARSLDSLLLTCGLAMMGAVNLLLGALPAAVGQELGTAAAWMSATGRLLATCVLVAAAWAPQRPVNGRGAPRLLFLAAANVLAVLWLILVFARGSLPLALDPAVSPDLSAHAEFVGHPLVHAIQLAGAVLFAAAAIGFLRSPGRDELARWLAPACVLAAFASIHYFMFPSLYSEWFYTGDIYRLAFYLLIVAGVAREIWRYQGHAQRIAVLEERRRIARDLHDGLAQELSYIVGAASNAVDGATARELRQLAGAAERALDESRRAIAALAQPPDDDLAVAIAQAAFEVANRVGARVELELDNAVRVPPLMREQLVRVVREAVTNAGRHGQAANVTVALRNGNGVSLTIKDDGTGFDTARPRSGGFGLISMRERAEAIGAEFQIRSATAEGTQVELTLPPAALQ